MKFKNILIILFIGILVFFEVPSATAQDSHDLQQVIGRQQKQLAEQQNQIDAQQRQLDLQQKMLKEMQEKLQGLTTGPGVSPAVTAREKPAAKPPVKTEIKSLETAAARRTDTRTARRDKNHPHEEWKGSFGMQGINTRFKIGGFAELDVIHDTDAIASKGQFVTSTIPTGDDGKKTQGADGQTSFSVSPTRLFLEIRTPLQEGRLSTFLSMDFYGDALSGPKRFYDLFRHLWPGGWQ